MGGQQSRLLAVDLDNIESMARRNGFAHPADTLLLVAEVRRLREALGTAPASPPGREPDGRTQE